MEFRELVRKNRSYRRFYQERRVDDETLRALVDLARLTPSGGNRQPVRYRLASDPSLCARVYETLSWAGYLSDWDGPAEGERPAAYVILLHDAAGKGSPTDEGIAAQTLLLGAAERGLGGCMLGSVDRKALAAILGVEARYGISLVIALGVPKETVVLDEAKDGKIEYWREADGTHHVPKRPLDEIIV